MEVKCEQPSTTPEKISKHFIRLIPSSPIRATQLRIPDEFITRFGNELKNVAKIIVPDGQVWEMKLKKYGGQVFFCNKWQEFADYYSIEYGCYLSFKYEGNSNFSVIIFDATSVEICYPLKTPGTNGEPSTKSHNPRKRIKVETSDIHVKQQVKIMSKRVRETAGAFKPKNPYFLSKCTKGNYAYVTSDFASNYLKSNVPINLQNTHGEQWEVFCESYDSKGTMQITKGFSIFLRDNNLSPGDYCVFELVKKNPVVLKVTMFRVVDYDD